jgi:hypothetical protein
MNRPYVPQAVLDAAHQRAAARAAGDWATADGLRAAIEAAGWRVIDRGTDFALEPAQLADIEVDGVVRYGRSSAVPSRLDEPPTAIATVIVVDSTSAASPDTAWAAGDGAGATLASLRAYLPAGVQLVLVQDGRAPDRGPELVDPPGIEVVRTATALGHGAAVNAGLRRAAGRVVVLLEPGCEIAGDVITPLVSALADAEVAVAGSVGLVSDGLRSYRPTTSAGDAIAIGWPILAFRRDDAVAAGPIDERFVSPDHFDAWWSLLLRDRGPDAAPLGVRVVADLPIRPPGAPGSDGSRDAEAARRAKRNRYRIMDRFRGRGDLGV